jgi:SAGA-associated factor 29
VLKFNLPSSKYLVLDDDQDETGAWVGGTKQHTVRNKCCMPLPLYEPSHYTPYNEFGRGTLVLALYPDTTCFYKAYVHTPPSERRQPPPKAYLVEFEDESELTGRSEPMPVPQKYVVAFQNT